MNHLKLKKILWFSKMRSKVLITGASGFIGLNLLDYLEKENFELYGWSNNQNIKKKEYIINSVDLTNQEATIESYSKILPDIIIHLAGFSSPKDSWKNPHQCFNTNLMGTINLFEAIKSQTYKPKKFLFFSTSGIFNSKLDMGLIKENFIPNPQDPYALSKFITEKYLTLIQDNFNTDIIVIRPFSIIGSGKNNDFCSDIAKQIIKIEDGIASEIIVGDLKIKRDFLDIQDAVKAIDLIINNKVIHKEYNLCSGKTKTLRDIIEIFYEVSKNTYNLIIDKNLIRKNEPLFRIGDNKRLIDLGWEPRLNLHQSIKDILTYWRKYKK